MSAQAREPGTRAKPLLALIVLVGLAAWWLTVPTSVSRFVYVGIEHSSITVYRDDAVEWHSRGVLTRRIAGTPGLFQRICSAVKDWDEPYVMLEGGGTGLRITHGSVRTRLLQDCQDAQSLWRALDGETIPQVVSTARDTPTAPDAAWFCRWPEGTVWTYDADFAGERRTVTYRVAGVEGSTRHVEFDIFREGDPGATASDELAWSESEGGVDWSIEEYDGRLTPRWRLWRAGARPGDSWPGPEGGETTYVADEPVTVPAGEYPRTVHLRIRCEVMVDLWYAPNVGLVRMVRTDGATVDTIGLRGVERPR